MTKETEENNPFNVINRSNKRIRNACRELTAALEEHQLIIESFCAGINASPTEIHNHTDIIQTINESETAESEIKERRYSLEAAAFMLNITYNRVLQHIRAGRLKHEGDGAYSNMYITGEELDRFARHHDDSKPGSLSDEALKDAMNTSDQ